MGDDRSGPRGMAAQGLDRSALHAPLSGPGRRRPPGACFPGPHGAGGRGRGLRRRRRDGMRRLRGQGRPLAPARRPGAPGSAHRRRQRAPGVGPGRRRRGLRGARWRPGAGDPGCFSRLRGRSVAGGPGGGGECGERSARQGRAASARARPGDGAPRHPEPERRDALPGSGGGACGAGPPRYFPGGGA